MKIDWGSPKEGVRGPTRQPERCLARPPPGRARHPPGCLVAPLGAPFRLYKPPGVETPKEESFSVFRRRHGAETYKGEKPSPAGRFHRGDHLPEGEIVAIIIIVVTCIIEIIINIIPNISR